MIPLKLAYLIADSTAYFAVGIISKGLGDTFASHAVSSGPFSSPQIVLLWAAFMFLHIAGPDTITAFELEDNELWFRFMLQLVLQSVTIVYMLASFPQNQLGASISIFVVAYLKYLEKGFFLYLSSSRMFQAGMLKATVHGPSCKRGCSISSHLQVAPFKDSDVVRPARQFYTTFKGLIVDLLLSFDDWKKSRSFFLKRTASDAFEVVEVELNFFYDALFTKFRMGEKYFVINNKVWTNVRLCFTFTVLLLALKFFFQTDKHRSHRVDVITYTLILTAMSQDIICGLVYLRKLIRLYLPPCPVGCLPPCLVRWLKNIKSRRWSESLPQYNLIRCFPYSNSKLKQITDIFDKIMYVKTVQFTKDLRDFIFEELKAKSQKATGLEEAKGISSAKGEYILKREAGCNSLLPYVETDYDDILIVWHVATELCYIIDRSNKETKTKGFRDISKVLSDYMLYLLLLEPAMMSVVAGISDIRYRDTCDQAKRYFFLKRLEVQWEKENQQIPKDKWLFKIGNHKCFCYRSSKEVRHSFEKFFIMSLLDASTGLLISDDLKAGKSVLFRACKLATELMKLDEERKWEIISKVWVELLCYAASHCGAGKLVAQVSKGGQLITVVWLLMTHFGLGDKFKQNDSI